MFTPVLSPGRLIDERLTDGQKRLIDKECLRIENELKKIEGLRLEKRVSVSAVIANGGFTDIVAWRFLQAGWQVQLDDNGTDFRGVWQIDLKFSLVPLPNVGRSAPYA